MTVTLRSLSIHAHAKCKIAAAMHWYVNSGAMTMAVTNAVDVVSSAINASLLTNDTRVCDHVFFSIAAWLWNEYYQCLPRNVKSIVVSMHQKQICHFSWQPPSLSLQRLTSVLPVLSSLWEIKSQTSSILLFSRIWCCWWKLETKCWESTFLAVWVAKQNVPSRLSDRAFSETHLIQTLHKLKVRKTISLTKLTQINIQGRLETFLL